MSKKKDEPRFEDLVAQVEEALQNLEGGELPLEDALKLYEEGVAGLRKCYEILKRAEKKVQLLTERDGEVAQRPFEEGEEPEEGGKLF
jgi:exodeoxyribonuclease VII small subunit